MRVFIGPPGETEVTGGAGRVEIERHEHDDFAKAIARIGLVYVRHDEATRATRDGIPYVIDEDVPPELRAGTTDATGPVDDGRAAERWEHVRGEIAWALEQTLRGVDAHEEFVIEPGDHALIPTGPGVYEVRTRQSAVVDMDGLRAHAARHRRGLRLFADYMEHL